MFKDAETGRVRGEFLKESNISKHACVTSRKYTAKDASELAGLQITT